MAEEGTTKISSPAAQLEPLKVKECSMSSVVVYRDRAEVKRLAPVSISRGENEIIFTGLSEAVDSESIRVEGQGLATILDVIYSKKEEKIENSADEAENANTHKGLLKQIGEKERELKYLEFRRSAIQKQKDLLDRYAKHVIEVGKQEKNEKSFPSLVNANTVSSVLQFMEQYKGRLANLDERLQEIDSIKKKLNEEKNVLVCKADEINPSKTGNKSETIRSVKVIVEASEDCDLMLILSYVVSNASWTPAYDIRVFTKDKMMKLQYYGMIKQSTGEDWNNASIALSTAQPDIGGSAPQLGIHHIGFVRPMAFAVNYNAMLKSPRHIYRDECYGAYDDSDDEYDPTIEDSYGGGGAVEFSSITLQGGYGDRNSSSKRKKGKKRYSPPSLEVEVAKVESGQLYNTTYSIPRTSTIPADNTEHKVTVAIIDLSPDFSYVSIPRKSPLSFLQAKVKNNSRYAFLSGPANVFLDNNFLAKSELSNTSPSEDFTCSLGADQSIRITPQPVAVVRGTTGRLTKSNLLTYTSLYAVKNTQANVVKIKVKDQVPLSSDERLKVVMVNPDIKKQRVSVQFPHGSIVLNDENIVEWSCTIPPNEEIQLKLVYSLEFPINDVVEGLQS